MDWRLVNFSLSSVRGAVGDFRPTISGLERYVVPVARLRFAYSAERLFFVAMSRKCSSSRARISAASIGMEVVRERV